MSTATPDKVIVTNLEQLKRKYGSQRVPALRQAVHDLIDADAARGLKTALVDLSSAAEMKKFKATPVKADKADDPKANKRAVDKVYKVLQPAYLLLLGAPDIIPHQDLENPVHSEADTDPLAESDLPYACDAAYSTNIRDFLAPTRVVGRLPDVRGGTDVNYLVGLLRTAAGYQSGPPADFDAFLAISTQTWQLSTDASLRAVFGSSYGLKVSPVDGLNWTAAEIKPRAHFINCHGAPADPKFYGEGDGSFPPAHDAALLGGRLTAGTVVAAECCYGAELYDPALAGGQLGICNTYLANQAYAFFGSSTIAYGPAVGNGQADLICQYFLQHVRRGASAGRAALQARFDYLQQATTLTPLDLKTLAQFNLLADPALTPVNLSLPAEPAAPLAAAAPAAPHILATTAKARTPAAARLAVDKAARFVRRVTLQEVGSTVANTVFRVANKVSKLAGGKKVLEGLLEEAAKLGLTNPSVLSFAVAGPPLTKALAAAVTAARVAVPTIVHSILERVPVPAEGGKIVHIKGLEAIQYDGEVEVRPFFSR